MLLSGLKQNLGRIELYVGALIADHGHNLQLSASGGQNGSHVSSEPRVRFTGLAAPYFDLVPHGISSGA
jgi:hypothetical protein